MGAGPSDQGSREDTNTHFCFTKCSCAGLNQRNHPDAVQAWRSLTDEELRKKITEAEETKRRLEQAQDEIKENNRKLEQYMSQIQMKDREAARLNVEHEREIQRKDREVKEIMTTLEKAKEDEEIKMKDKLMQDRENQIATKNSSLEAKELQIKDGDNDPKGKNTDSKESMVEMLKDTNKKVHGDGNLVPKDLAVDSLESGVQWKADLSWSIELGMRQSPQGSFLISYCSDGAEPQNSTAPLVYRVSTTLTGLLPDTQYTAHVCTETQSGEKTETASTTFYTSEWRIVLLGKTGDGKSSTGNTILGKDVFKVDNSPVAVTNTCEEYAKILNGKKITVIDTPGFLDPQMEESKIGQCLSLTSPGPHAFVLVLNAKRCCIAEQEVIKEIEHLFASQVFKYTVIVFTYGEQLKNNNQSIKEFIGESSKDSKGKTLPDLVYKKCGGRYHVVDNLYWKEEQEGEYSNRRQIEKLFDTIEKMVQRNGGYYTKPAE